MSNRKPAGVYVELDCLMDTRFATLLGMDKEKASYILMDNYHIRTSDNWEGIDMKDYRERYKNRNLYTLSQSTLTSCVSLLNKVGMEIASTLVEDPVYDSLHLYINTYPYHLDEDELTDLEISLKQWISAPYEYHFLYLPPEDINVRYVNDKFYVMVMYDFSSWLEMHLKEFQNCPLYEVTLFSPRININQNPDENDLKELRNLGMEGINDEFDLYEKIAMSFIHLMLIDVVYFSILKPDFEELYEKNPNPGIFGKAAAESPIGFPDSDNNNNNDK